VAHVAKGSLLLCLCARSRHLVKLGLNKEKPKENTLEIYRQHFEDDFITATEVYYTAESTHFIATNSVAEYMKKVETRLDEETRRVQQYLNPTTETELVQKCDRVLIEKHLDTIRSDFQNMLTNDKIDGAFGSLAHIVSIPHLLTVV
jgi:cullin 1